MPDHQDLNSIVITGRPTKAPAFDSMATPFEGLQMVRHVPAPERSREGAPAGT
jgi:hypothetical protein